MDQAGHLEAFILARWARHRHILNRVAQVESRSFRVRVFQLDLGEIQDIVQ